MIIYLLIGLIFSVGGIVLGVLPLGKIAIESWHLSRYVEVPATVLDVGLHEDSDGDQWVNVRYSYRVHGRTLVGDRIGMSMAGSTQLSWHARLQAARHSGRTIPAWIDPQHPGLSLLTREVPRGAMLMLLTLAMVFPALGLGALWQALGLLRSRRLSAQAQQDKTSDPSRALKANTLLQATGMGIFATLWNLLALPATLLTWGEHGVLSGEGLFMSLFAAIGLLLISLTGHLLVSAYRSRGVTLHLGAEGLHAREPAQVIWHLPAHRVRRAQSRPFRVHLSQARLRGNNSDNTWETVWTDTLPCTLHPQPDGSAQLQTELRWPDQAQPSGVNAEGDRVAWSMALGHEEQTHEQTFDVQVGAGRVGRVVPWATPTDGDGDSATPPPPSLVRIHTTPGLWVARFRPPHRAILAVLSGLAAGAMGLVARSLWGSDEQIDAIVWLTVIVGSCLMLAGMLHVLTRQWLIGVEAGSWWLDRSSAWRRQRHVLPPRDASSLHPRHVYTTSPGTIGVQHHHRVELHSSAEGTMAISPALPSRAMALGLIDQLSLAQAPAADASLPAEWATHATPDTVWRARHRVVNGVAWLLLSALILVLSTRAEDHLGSHPAAAWQGWHNALLAQGELALGIGLAERALLRAIDGDRDEDVESALRQGAHPDATGERGSSALMLAATRGKLSTVNILLTHGADVQFVNQTSVNERGDTALLRAAYFGHAEVFQRLLEAGARTDVRNRWDWTPVHMASMGGCLPCLEQLRTRGLSLDARATASRGESPLMLAAAKGQIPAMQWLIEHGADTAQRDDHGQDVMAWARFFKQGDSERWLRDRIQ